MIKTNFFFSNLEHLNSSFADSIHETYTWDCWKVLGLAKKKFNPPPKSNEMDCTENFFFSTLIKHHFFALSFIFASKNNITASKWYYWREQDCLFIAFLQNHCTEKRNIFHPHGIINQINKNTCKCNKCDWGKKHFYVS